jgi:hypothetical protein
VLAERADAGELLDQQELATVAAAHADAVAVGHAVDVVTAAATGPTRPRGPRPGALDAIKAAAELAATTPSERDDQLARIHAVLADFGDPPAPPPPVAPIAPPAPTAVTSAAPAPPTAPSQGADMQHDSISPLGRTELITEVARGLGISEDTLCRWMPADAFDLEPPRVDAHDPEAVARLTRAVLVLELQNEVLKRALSRVAE